MNKIVQAFSDSKVTQFIHIDEEINKDLLVTKKQLWDQSLKLFNDIVGQIKSAQLTSIKVDLQIELVSDQNVLKGVPEKVEFLINSIDEFTMPEVVISSPKRDFWHPKNEMYTCPISFEIKELGDDIYVLYEEYRTIEEKKEDLEFTRWLVISYFDE